MQCDAFVLSTYADANETTTNIGRCFDIENEKKRNRIRSIKNSFERGLFKRGRRNKAEPTSRLRERVSSPNDAINLVRVRVFQTWFLHGI